MKDIKKDFSLDMAPCLCVKVVNGNSYLLDAMAFAKNLVKYDNEGDTMSKSGWVVDFTKDSRVENLKDVYIGCFKKVTQHLGSLRARKVRSKRMKIQVKPRRVRPHMEMRYHQLKILLKMWSR